MNARRPRSCRGIWAQPNASPTHHGRQRQLPTLKHRLRLPSPSPAKDGNWAHVRTIDSDAAIIGESHAALVVADIDLTLMTDLSSFTFLTVPCAVYSPELTGRAVLLARVTTARDCNRHQDKAREVLL